MVDVRMRDLPPRAEFLLSKTLSQVKRLRGSCGYARPTHMPEKLPTVAVYHDSVVCQYRLEARRFRVACLNITQQILLLPMLCSRVQFRGSATDLS
jgi:hypothetical protein